MKINFTLLIQLCNFGVTYYFLRAFLFGPIIKLKQHRVAMLAGMCNDVEEQQRAIDALKEQQRNGKVCFQQHLLDSYIVNPMPHKRCDEPKMAFKGLVEQEFSDKNLKLISSRLVKRIQESC